MCEIEWEPCTGRMLFVDEGAVELQSGWTDGETARSRPETQLQLDSSADQSYVDDVAKFGEGARFINQYGQ